MQITFDCKIDDYEYFFLKSLSKKENIWDYFRIDKDWLQWTIKTEMGSEYRGLIWQIYSMFLKLGIVTTNNPLLFSPQATALVESLIEEWEAESVNQAKLHYWKIKYETKDVK
jgi:hypothetical protein